MAKNDNATRITDVTPADFIESVDHEVRRADAHALDAMFQRVTGWKPRMWGPSIIGYGQYHYRYDTGREGDFLATGFSPRKAQQVLYIMPGYADLEPWLDRLGKHKIGKSCLYVTQLSKVDMTVLEEIVTEGLRRLREMYEVQPT